MGAGFLPNVKQMAIKAAEDAFQEIEKNPDVIIAQNDIINGFTALEALEAKVTPAEIEAALNILFPGKFSVAEITTAEAAVTKLLGAFSKLQAALTAEATKLGK